jgi:hypothetical protein
MSLLRSRAVAAAPRAAPSRAPRQAAARRTRPSACAAAPDFEAQLDAEEEAARAAGKPWSHDDRTLRKYFLVYKSLGGQRSEAQYMDDLYHFIEYTREVFTMGEDVVVTRTNGRRVKLDSRDKACRAFTKDYLGGDRSEWNRFFTSVDSVTAYT